MKRAFPIRSERAVAVIALGAFLAAAGSTFAQAPKPKGFDDFQLVKTRNIFDPNRRAIRSEGSRDSRSTTRITRPNTLSLTGTMVTDGRMLAFFSGSRSEHSKVIGVGESVAEYKVKSIATTQVELEKDGKATPLAVGKTLTLEGTTEVVADSAAASETSADPTSAAAPAAGTAPAPTNAKEELLRKMRERHEKENK